MSQRLAVRRTTAPKSATASCPCGPDGHALDCPERLLPEKAPSLAAALRRVDPAAESAASFAFREVKRRGLVPKGTTFERWIADAVAERAVLLVELMVSGVCNGYRVQAHADQVEVAGTVRTMHLVA